MSNIDLSASLVTNFLVHHLCRWKTKNGQDITPVRFRRALINTKLMFIVHKYFDSGHVSPTYLYIPYSLKYSKLKKFTVFVGCTLCTKILFRKNLYVHMCYNLWVWLFVRACKRLLLALSESSLVGSRSWF